MSISYARGNGAIVGAAVVGALLWGPAHAQDAWSGFDFGVPIQQPFVCENDAHGVTLEITGEPCQAEAIVDYVYRAQGGGWQPFDPEGERPADIAETMTNRGIATPLIVRREFGKTANGSTYVIGMLHDPASGDIGPDNPSAGWNGRLIIAYGGGVQANFHSGRSCGTNANLAFVGDGGSQGYQDIFIERGYAVACGSLMVMGTNNDDIKSAETTLRVKERFAELYGQPEFSIGVGASGGSMQQLLIANNYPGLLDGIMPKRDYPDGISFLQPLHDCELLVHAADDSDLHWTEAQLTAVSGYATFDYCRRNGARYPNLRPDNCDGAVIDELAFNPVEGVRCTYHDNLAYLYGTEEVEGAVDALGNPSPRAARSVYDNVGVQYGLKAFNDGVISFEQFIDLNRNIGGFDINGAVVDARSAGSEEAIRLAYETGRLNRMGAGLAEVPIIDVRRWRDIPMPLDNPTDIDVHDASHSRTVRERLIAANGHANNHVIITAADDNEGRGPGTPIASALARGLAQMDEWLVSIQSDPRDIPLAQKIAENKPEDLVDSCWINADVKVTDPALCSAIFPYAGHPRLVAGGPLTEDVLKCQLKPLNPLDYSRSLSADEWEALEATFPEGVCDYSRPGVGDVPLAGTWLSYSGDSTYSVHAAAQ